MKYKENKKVYVNEPNIIPGSLAFYLWKPVGKDYTTLLDDIITFDSISIKICEILLTEFSLEFPNIFLE